MFKHALCAAAAAITLAGCASNSGTSSEASNTPAPAAAAPATSAAPTPEAAAPMTPATPGTYTDAQLRSFGTAAHDIQPLNAQLSSPDAATKNAAVEQVRAILARNNLDAATYNAIAQQAQADPALAARIASLSPPNSAG